MRQANLVLLILALSVLLAPRAQAQLPHVVSYQGYLEQTGEPVNDPSARLIFRIYDVDEGGTALWTEQHLDVPVVDGIFSVLLGTIEPAGFQVLPFGDPLWLGVALEGGELSPRAPLVAVPFSMQSRHANSVAGLRVIETTAEDAPSIIAGHPSNDIGAGVDGATISGGGYDDGATDVWPNHVEADYGAIGGGRNNAVSEFAGTVGGGTANLASGDRATVGGGYHNLAEAKYATVGGGGPENELDASNTSNRVTDNYGTVSGGGNNQAGDGTLSATDAEYATVGGGRANSATGAHSMVGGGWSNTASGGRSTVGGGDTNVAAGSRSTVGGGQDNVASGSRSTVGGGHGNIASGNPRSTVGGGAFNTARGRESTVGGGIGNVAGGEYSTVGGGWFNRASGDYSMAAGYNAKARHEGAFAWSDHSQTASDESDSLYTTNTNQFLIRAAGGVGIGTNVPSAFVHITGDSHGGRPLLFLHETGAGDFARLRLQNSDPSADYWDVSAGGANTDHLSFYTRGNNVVTFWPHHIDFVNLITTSVGAVLTQGGMWQNNSSRASKKDFRRLDARTMLEQVVALPVLRWRYNVEPATVSHIGPVAEDFYGAFGLGSDDATIGTADADGVALAAIQGLYELLKEQQEIARRQQAEIEKLREDLKQLKARESID